VYGRRWNRRDRHRGERVVPARTRRRGGPCRPRPRAPWSDSDFLSTLGIETEQEPDGPVQEIVTDGEGRSSVDGIWAAGRITGTHHQALVSAGDGARVALNLVGELVPDVLRRLGRTRGVLQQHGRSIPVGVEEISHDERIRRAEHGCEWLIEFFELQQSP
jgi:hypothetical protein